MMLIVLSCRRMCVVYVCTCVVRVFRSGGNYGGIGELVYSPMMCGLLWRLARGKRGPALWSILTQQRHAVVDVISCTITLELF